MRQVTLEHRTFLKLVRKNEYHILYVQKCETRGKLIPDIKCGISVGYPWLGPAADVTGVQTDRRVHPRDAAAHKLWQYILLLYSTIETENFVAADVTSEAGNFCIGLSNEGKGVCNPAAVILRTRDHILANA